MAGETQAHISRPPVLGKEEAARRRLRRMETLRQNKRLRDLVTPEGAALKLRIASAGERAGAFLIDLSIQFFSIFVGLWLIGITAAQMGYDSWNIAGAIAMVFIFAVRNFYFIAFEIGRKAATPGKRLLGLRVAARNGGRLTANAVIARNLMREMEVILPIQFLFMGAFGNGWMPLLGLIWTGTFLFFPLFNSDKLRAGDIIAGTWVIHAPKTKLMSDIASAVSADKAGRFTFTPEQLDAYGIHELHVLEDVLRQSTDDVKISVTARIQTKISWQTHPGE